MFQHEFELRVFHSKQLINSMTKFNFMFPISRKKSVDDLLTSTQDVMNQAIQLTTQSVKRSPSPSKTKIGSSADELVSEEKKQH